MVGEIQQKTVVTTTSQLLWPKELVVRWDEVVMECVQECQEQCTIVGTEGGMVMEDTMVTHCRTHGDLTSTLSRDLNNGRLAD